MHIINKNVLEKWFEYRNQNEFGIIEFNTITKKYKILNSKYDQIYDSNESQLIEFDPASLLKMKHIFS